MKTQRSKLFRNSLTLAFGALIARGIGIIAMPFITRLYSPVDMGVLGVFTSAILIAGPLLSLRYTSAILIPKQDALAILLAISSMLLSTILALIFAIAVYASKETSIYGQVFGNYLSEYWLLIPIGALLVSILEILVMWNLRKERYKVISISQASQSFLGTSAKLLLGLWGAKPFGLLLGQLMQQGGGVIRLGMLFFNDLKKVRKRFKIARALKHLVLFGDFPKIRLPAHIVFVLSMQLPMLCIALIYGSAAAGQAALAFMAVAAPLGIIGNTISQAYYVEVSKLGRKRAEDIYNLTCATLKKLLLFGVIPAVLLNFWGEDIFVMVFGSQWLLAGTFVSSMAVFLLFQFASAPLAKVLNIVGAQHIALTLSTVRLLMTLVTFGFAAWYPIEHTTAISLYSVQMSIFYVVYAGYILKSISSACEVNK